ncbi:MAG: hypothetical protein PHN42_01310 [Bacilli bacterium]|nr:hypothetical protein [Bacilli bacterium]
MDFKKIGKNVYVYFGVGFGVMLFFIIIILILSVMFGGKVSIEVAKKKIQNAAIVYYKNNQDELPIVGESTFITMDKLVEKKLIKSFDNLLKNQNTSCEAKVTVENNNGFYLYSTDLNCEDDYQTTYLYEKVKSDNLITTDSDGLYEINNSLVFRGEDLNNYVSFANKIWRIIKINTDNSIRLIEVTSEESFVWDDRYNNEVESNTGINDYRVSRIKDTLETLYNDENKFTEADKAFIVAQDICLGKQAENSSILDGSVECSDVLENQYISMLEVYEYALASIDNNCNSLDDRECSNYNYISAFDKSFWTITASSEISDRAFKISTYPDLIRTANATAINLVIHISSNAIYLDGDGSFDKPYTIKND